MDHDWDVEWSKSHPGHPAAKELFEGIRYANSFSDSYYTYGNNGMHLGPEVKARQEVKRLRAEESNRRHWSGGSGY